MDDRANIAFAALPERLYVVQDGQIVYQVSLFHWNILAKLNILNLESQEQLDFFKNIKPTVSGRPWSFWLQDIRSWGFLGEEQIEKKKTAPNNLQRILNKRKLEKKEDFKHQSNDDLG